MQRWINVNDVDSTFQHRHVPSGICQVQIYDLYKNKSGYGNSDNSWTHQRARFLHDWRPRIEDHIKGYLLLSTFIVATLAHHWTELGEPWSSGTPFLFFFFFQNTTLNTCHYQHDQQSIPSEHSNKSQGSDKCVHGWGDDLLRNTA